MSNNLLAFPDTLALWAISRESLPGSDARRQIVRHSGCGEVINLPSSSSREEEEREREEREREERRGEERRGEKKREERKEKRGKRK